MRFLIDENPTPTLADMARERGWEAMAVRDLGLLNAKDWTLLQAVREHDWILVTNNMEEFRRRFARGVELHAGIVFPADVDAGRDVQRLAWGAALDDLIAAPDLVNTELLVIRSPDGTLTIRREPLP